MSVRKSRDIAVLSILHGLMGKFGKLYCYPSQDKICELLMRFPGIGISRSTLNRWLRVMEDEGLVKRTRRIRKNSKYGYEFQSTLYEITIIGYRLLASIGMKVHGIIGSLVKWAGVKKSARRDAVPKRKPGSLESVKEVIKTLGFA